MRIAVTAFALAITCALPSASADEPAEVEVATTCGAADAGVLIESSINPRFAGAEKDLVLEIRADGAWKGAAGSGCLSAAQVAELTAAIDAATFGAVEEPGIRCMAMPVVDNTLASPLKELTFSWGTPCGIPPHASLVALGALAEGMTAGAQGE